MRLPAWKDALQASRVDEELAAFRALGADPADEAVWREQRLERTGAPLIAAYFCAAIA
jgi:hypothetical protein